VKKLVKFSAILLSIVASLSSCSSSEKYIEKGYSYTVVDEPATVKKVWMPKHVKYSKKRGRYHFFNGHYRLTMRGQAWTYRQARLRNRPNI
jgi:hypothetical protein